MHCKPQRDVVQKDERLLRAWARQWEQVKGMALDWE